MTVRVGINGFGRMGFRADGQMPGYGIVHLNGISAAAACTVHLQAFDSALVDASPTMLVDRIRVKVLAGNDSERGYVNRGTTCAAIMATSL